MSTFPIVSESSATALLSDLRPTTVQPQTLEIINAFLDELLVATVATANSINPEHFRYRGVQGSLGSLPTPNSPAQQASLGPLGRAVVGEAELELRSWYEGHPTAQRGQSGFAPDGNGRGMVGPMERAGLDFPLAQATQLMRLKVAMLSSFAPPPPDHQDEIRIIEAWAEAGGDISEETVTPAALWLTAMAEHISEHLLQKIAQVVGRDSAVMAADVQHLYTALCEDDCLYFFFRRMNIRSQIETIIAQQPTKQQPVGKRSRTTSQTIKHSRSATSDVEIGSKSSLGSASVDDPAAIIKENASRPVSENFYKNLRNVGKSSKNNHKRATSILGISNFPLGHTHIKEDPVTDVTLSAADAEFEAFLRSGETMRVSLTPSRFSTLGNTLTSPSATSFSRLPGDGANVNQSSSESSLITASTQSSGESGRPNHRVMGGRQTWTAGNAGWSPNNMKLRTRRTTLDEPLEEEDLTTSPTVMELIEASPEPEDGSPTPGSTQVTPEAADAGSRHASASFSDAHLAEPEKQDSNEVAVNGTDARPSTVRSASESVADRGPNGTYRSARNPRIDQLESRQESRDLANFLSTTAPPLRSASAPHSIEVSQRELSKRHKLKDLMSRIGPYRRDRVDPHDPPPAILKLPWDKDRQPVSSSDFNKPRQASVTSSNQSLTPNNGTAAAKSLRSQRSVSSVGTASSIPMSIQSSASTKDVMRKPSLMRKWAHHVTEPARQRRTSATAKGLSSSPLLSQSHSRLSEVDEDTADSLAGQSRTPGLGLGGLGLGMPPSILESERSEVDSELEHNLLVRSDTSLVKSESSSQPKSPVVAAKGDEIEQLEESEVKDAVGEHEDESSPLPQTTGSHHVESPSPSADTMPSVRSSPRVADTPSLVQESTWPMPPEVPMSPQAPSPSPSQASSSRLSMRPLPERPGERRTSRELPRPPQPGSASTTASARLSKQDFPSPRSSVQEFPDSRNYDTIKSPILRSLPEVPHEEQVPELDPGATIKAMSPSSVAQPLRHDRVASLSAQGVPSPKTSPTLSQQSILEDKKIDGGYVHVSELAHLRSLLANATSVRECQILVDSTLSRLGVPRDAGSVGDREERITEWLCSDRSGPFGDNVSELQTPNGSPKLKLKTHRSSLSTGSGKRIISRKSSKGSAVESLSPEITMKNLPALPVPEGIAPEPSSPTPTPSPPTPTTTTAAAAAAAQREPPYTLVETKS